MKGVKQRRLCLKLLLPKVDDTRLSQLLKCFFLWRIVKKTEGMRDDTGGRYLWLAWTRILMMVWGMSMHILHADSGCHVAVLLTLKIKQAASNKEELSRVKILPGRIPLIAGLVHFRAAELWGRLPGWLCILELGECSFMRDHSVHDVGKVSINWP